MALMIQEYTDGSKFNYQFVENNAVENFKNAGLNIAEASNDDPVDPNSLMVDIEGIHAYPHATRNFTRYMPECLKKSVNSWTKPYRRPLIKHHNEKNSPIIGRVISAAYKEDNTLSGTPALLFTANVPDEKAMEEIKNGTESTVSIGVIAYDVRCSICGGQINEEGRCAEDHERGNKYGSEICYWDMYSIEAKELSYVIVPSDVYAKNVKIYSATSTSKTPAQVSEGLDVNIKNKIKEGDNKMADNGKSAELVAAEAQIADLQKQVNENSSELASMKVVKENLEKQIKNLEESVNGYKKDIENANSVKESLENKIADLNKEIENMKSAEAEAKTMREGLETALADSKVAAKESLIDTAQAWRKILGKKEYEADDIKNRSEEAIRCSIKDMKEEFSEKSQKVEEGVNDTPIPQQISSPAIVDNTGSGIDTKESTENDEEPIDLEAGIQNIFSNIMSHYGR